MERDGMHRHHGRAILITGLLVIFSALLVMWLRGEAERNPVPAEFVVQKTDWTKYGSDEDGDHYYKMDTSGGSPGIVSVWSQVVYNKNGKEKYIQKRQQLGFSTEQYDTFTHRNVLYEINCFSKKKELCIQEVFELTKDGKTLDYAKAGTYKDWTEIPPGTVFESLYTAACPAKQ